MKNLCLWTIITVFGLGLLFNGEIRNDYFTAFSYLFPTNTTQTQNLADGTRLLLGLIMTLSILNVFSGLLFKTFSVISFVIYSVVINQQFILNPSIQNKQSLCSIATHLVLTFFCMDSIITQIINQETSKQKQKTQNINKKVKQQISQSQPAKLSEESKKEKTEKETKNVSAKDKTAHQSKHDKKQAANQQKPKKA